MAGYHTQGEYDRDREATKRMLKETYVGAIVHLQERQKEGADEEEMKQMEEFLMANERMIVFFDEGEQWLKEFHDEAERNAKQNGEYIDKDEPEDEFERLAKAGNFERIEN
jgi:hypothetical protein